MRKHQFIKEKCECSRRATRFICRYCKALEYLSSREIRQLTLQQARCDHPEAPEIPSTELFRARLGGPVNCLAPDWETHNESHDTGECPQC
ncbi:hypothetical protein [Megalodesulfovibrio paquesii]